MASTPPISNVIPIRVSLVDETGELITSANPLDISASFTTGDIQIGAVEIKNDSDDTRLKIGGGVIANAARVTIGTDDTMIGALAETAPASDTASSGINGRLQRISQRLTSLIAATLITKEVRAATATPSNVASSASSVTILASNANRLGATVFNDSTQVLYLLFGSGTASATNYSVQMATLTYFEVPFEFTGQLTGIWASANGAARVTEIAA